jgi:protocatechuate 3,4-dioxygenase beta subunit
VKTCPTFDGTRRRFIKSSSFALAVLPTVPFSGLLLGACSRADAGSSQQADLTKHPSLGGAPCGSCDAPTDLSWNTVVTSRSEPGEPMEISGTIYQTDGVAPAEGVGLFIYHTDASGHYNKDDEPSRPQIRGWMKTGADGQYNFRTIKPAPYPGKTIPAHIHAHLYGRGFEEYWIDEYWFAGDPLITAENTAKLTGRGGFHQARNPADIESIVSLTRGSDGVLRGTRNIKLQKV